MAITHESAPPAANNSDWARRLKEQRLQTLNLTGSEEYSGGPLSDIATRVEQGDHALATERLASELQGHGSPEHVAAAAERARVEARNAADVDPNSIIPRSLQGGGA